MDAAQHWHPDPRSPTSKLGGIRAPNPKAENLLSLEERLPITQGPWVPGGHGVGGGCFGDAYGLCAPLCDAAQALL